MNQKRKVDKQYQPLTPPKFTIEPEFRVSPRRVLKPGVVCKIHGQRGGLFRYQYAQINRETGAVSLYFVGGRNGHLMDRFFRPEQVGATVRKPQ